MWLEQLARTAGATDPYPLPFSGEELDFRPLLHAVVADRVGGRALNEIARAFQRGVAQGLADAVISLSREKGVDTVVLSGGVFQNELLLQDLHSLLASTVQLWTNRTVPANDGGISLGQSALAAFGQFNAV
jgi:hydrogenase maturation protein HypF